MPARSASANTTISGRMRKTRRNRNAVAISATRAANGSVSGSGDTGARAGRRPGISASWARSTTLSPPRPGLQQVDGEKQDERRHQHQAGDHGGAGIVELLQLDDDEQRHDLGVDGHVAGDADLRAVLPDGAGKASVKPVISAGSSGGSTTRRRMLAREAPSMAADSSSSRSKSISTGSTVRTTNGRPTKMSAMRMPSGVNATFTSIRDNGWPSQPCTE